MKAKKCDYYRKGHWFLKCCGTCLGTKEKEPCECKGDRRRCDFYPEVRRKARNESI